MYLMYLVVFSYTLHRKFQKERTLFLIACTDILIACTQISVHEKEKYRLTFIQRTVLLYMYVECITCSVDTLYIDLLTSPILAIPGRKMDHYHIPGSLSMCIIFIMCSSRMLHSTKVSSGSMLCYYISCRES